MDTTPEYIKMCERAEEIQNDWILHKGDYYYHKLNNKISFVSGWFEARTAENAVLMTHYHGRLIWLPRQDQLQEMLHCSIGEGMNRLWAYFPEWFCKIGAVEYSKSSWEQLWLAFVMKEKYGKVWNGEGWV